MMCKLYQVVLCLGPQSESSHRELLHYLRSKPRNMFEILQSRIAIASVIRNLEDVLVLWGLHRVLTCERVTWQDL